MPGSLQICIEKGQFLPKRALQLIHRNTESGSDTESMERKITTTQR